MKPQEAVAALVAVIRKGHLSRATEHSYSGWLRRYIGFLGQYPGRTWTTEEKIGGFLSELARSGISASTQNQAFNAILFFYKHVLRVEPGDIKSQRAKAGQIVRIAPSQDQVKRLLAGVEDVGGYPTKLIVRMIYGMGLRVSEPLNLRIKDIGIDQSRVTIHAAKGQKDRVVPIPCALMREILVQMEIAKGVAESDRLAGLPVSLPGLLSAKSPGWQWSPAWAWLFPSRTSCWDDRLGKRVRFRCHEVNVQRSVRAAARPLGLWITPHHLRHAYATHVLAAGGNPRALQAVLGHESLETTMGYIHADALAVRSPIDSLLA